MKLLVNAYDCQYQRQQEASIIAIAARQQITQIIHQFLRLTSFYWRMHFAIRCVCVCIYVCVCSFAGCERFSKFDLFAITCDCTGPATLYVRQQIRFS